ncbi:CinA family nicotinamide mononucleotide deamidase-related protein [Paraferrimonas sp. SM1919]|uniref:CinA family nicotinamide mononucleotide deamidase-related protein n=1 Tax=Paraferrimonas sp. SM1919 TaxID=2662263 RepID=UPI0013D73D06|nr:CinA family nicotinamide mononucleotide deamidase-related protein [Paraferrimonas sp. SM1919]
MKIEMICTGEEVLSGQIVDTNAAWFANEMMERGWELTRKTTVGDRLNELVEIFSERSLHADIILVNGGLGPTVDDLSSEACAQALGVELVHSDSWQLRLEQMAQQFNRPLPKNNLKQCLLPAGAQLVDNPYGTACGFKVKLNNAWLFFTPGVPHEFKPMVTEQLLPWLERFDSHKPATRLIKLLTYGYGESHLAQLLSDVVLHDGQQIGYRASMPIVEVKLFARGTEAVAALDDLRQQVSDKLGDALLTTEGHTQAQAIHHLLLQKQVTLALAESCSGGMMASQLVEFAGSSKYLLHSVVSYSNQAKQKILGVDGKLLQEFGAVSEATAIAMATATQSLASSDYGLSITGIAGPQGGSDDKPVGTVFIALSTPSKVYCRHMHFNRGGRTRIRQAAVAMAFDMLRRELEGIGVFSNYPSLSSSVVDQSCRYK